MSRLVRYGPLCAAFALLSACGSTEVECVDDRTCDSGQRCVIEDSAAIGICGPCAAGETPYNGVDDDCNPRTPDVDLDGDGDNAIDSPFLPGGDCDDDDPTVASRLGEACGDGKDNDCDGDVDEPDCADEAPPRVTFLTPQDGDAISGQAPLRIQVDDDVGVTEIVVRANNVDVGRMPVSELRTSQTINLMLSTTSLADGEITLRAEAVDLRGEVGSSLIRVTIDNTTPPTIEIGRPLADAAYGGQLTVTATVEDPVGVQNVEFVLDMEPVATATGAPYRYAIDTTTLDEGPHELLLRASDTNGNASTRMVPFFVDNTPPVLRFLSPANGASVLGAFSVVVTATDASGLRTLESEGRATRRSPLLYDIDTSTVPDGPYVLTAAASDRATVDDMAGVGNTVSRTVTVLVDNPELNPIVQFASPMDGDGVVARTTHELNVVSEVGTPILGVDLFVDGRFAGSDTTAPFAIPYDYRALTGTVTVTAIALDDASNSGRATITVDVTDFPNLRVAPNAGVQGSIGASGFAVGDVTGDGVQDVVTTGSVLGVATGTVGPDGEWGVFGVAQLDRRSFLDVRTVDLDGDQDLDLVCFSSTDLQTYINDGQGQFTLGSAEMFPENGVTAFEVADLDGDADLDLVAVGGSVPGIVGFVYRFDRGRFNFVQNLGGDAGAADVALGDINDDQLPDVVVGRSGTNNVNVTVYLNGGNATFGAGIDTPAASSAERVHIGDVDGAANGRPEILVALPSADAFQIFQVTGTRPFSLAAQAPLRSMDQPRSIAVGQLVGDPTPDVVLGSFQGNGFQVFAATSTVVPTFALDETYIMTQDLRNLQLTDLDGDGDLDVIAAGQQENVLSWARNLGNGKFFASIATLGEISIDPANGRIVPLTPRAVALGNVTGSPAADVVVTYDRATPFDPQLVLYELSNGRFVNRDQRALPASVNPPASLAVGGAPASGFDYVAVAANASPINNAPTAVIVEFVSPMAITTDFLLDRPRALAIGDVDSDGIGELVVALDPQGTAQDGSLVIDLDTGLIRAPLLAGEGAGSVAVADLDNDMTNALDYAVSNLTSENITVQLWNGTGFSATTYNAPSGLGPITTGLVGADGFVDIVGIASNTIFVMEGDPAFGFRTPVTFPAGQNPSDVVGGDFNGDGLFDVLTLNPQGRASLLIARPQGGFFDPVSIPVGDNPTDFTVGDIDGDGRPDVIITCAGVPTIVTLFNNGDSL